MGLGLAQTSGKRRERASHQFLLICRTYLLYLANIRSMETLLVFGIFYLSTCLFYPVINRSIWLVARPEGWKLGYPVLSVHALLLE